MRIDERGTGGAPDQTITTFSSPAIATSGSLSYFQVHWATWPSAYVAGRTYRAHVLLPDGRALGFADLRIVATAGEVPSPQPADEYVIAKGRTLTINFRIAPAVVDGDGDSVLDSNDNCPLVANVDQQDTDADLIGDACECAGVVCPAPAACHLPGTCDPTSGACTDPLAPDGPFEGSTATSCGEGACASTGRTECRAGEIIDTCTPLPIDCFPASFSAADVYTGAMTPLAINSSGQFVGEAQSRAFIWRDGAVEDLGVPTTRLHRAIDINESGQVIVKFLGTPAQSSYLWDDGALTNLGSLDGAVLDANDINDAGQIVGCAGSRAFLWQNGSATLLPNTPYGASCANAINNAGQIVGYVGAPNSARHAALWQNGVVTDLGTLGGVNSYATDINEAGDIIGGSATAGGGVAHGFIRRGGVMTQIQFSSGIGFLTKLNNLGQVIGAGYPDGSSHGYIWENGVVRELEGFDRGWTAPFDIDDHGRIAGEAIYLGQSVPVLWDGSHSIDLCEPVGHPEPSTYGRAVLISNNGLIVGRHFRSDGDTTAVWQSTTYAEATCIATCGDGVAGAGEDCDDGNRRHGDGCDGNCTTTACGNGIRTSGEACDDGNLSSGDGCESDCTITYGAICGDGIHFPSLEECDDGNTAPWDGCESDCRLTPGIICGDGLWWPPTEQCDDGNTIPNDGCEPDCTWT